MTIVYNEQSSSFHLYNTKVSYQLAIVNSKYISHVYWGKTVGNTHTDSDFPMWDRSFSPNPSGSADRNFSLNTLPQEYPGHNNGDYRESAFAVTCADGTFSTQFEYDSYAIKEGKAALKGLPHTYASKDQEAQMLTIQLKDKLKGLKLELMYTIFEDYPIITRSVKLSNEGSEPVEINKLLSASIDYDHADFDLIQLPGGWGRERDIVRHPVHRGVHKIDSKRGTTSHTYQPFLALCDPKATEHTGDIYGMHFVYSGEFMANVEVTEYNHTRIQMGISPEYFNWTLQPDEGFQAPEVVMSYSPDGLNEFSQSLHRFYQKHLIRGQHQFKERPVLMNNWEGTYFDFSEEKILDMADQAVQLGIELFVLDDGWFGKRNDDRSSLGDWTIHREKLPNGLKSLAEKIKAKGLKFGLWFEPEMISEDSELYRAHPDWVLKAVHREASVGRDQYILDYTRKEVRENIINQIKAVLDTVPIDYIKWDFNRNMTEIGSQDPSISDGTVTHRYMLGLYEVMETLTTAYPHILWESCSGGGGRYDPGMLHYMPQTWTSDNTDAVARLEIQTGTSLVFPISSMGSHVSSVPNHQVNRTTSLKMRGDVASAGNLGYELDPTVLTADESRIVKKQIDFYKNHRQLIQYGLFYRLKSPFEGNNEVAWMFVDENQTEALFFYYLILDKTNTLRPRVTLTGLDPHRRYTVKEKGESEPKVYYGSELMYKGLFVQPPLAESETQSSYQINGDFRSVCVQIKAVD
ncbi:Alpha-galactosidase [Alkalibacterium sp. AK22]|uniref:alpha-galactosidase n=1 Tax=Alkalibacterium sp. AK22 TaxID=1229520 RepID=UPI00044ED5FF|nr:alpha-galactosidase [Alkalibacterium sp. AK22]EXJ23337.1 Alpha-galactosidase [Alkalibacterium sp. AK22]